MYHRKQSIVSQDHSYLTISASSLTRFYFKLASNRLELSPIHPNTPISSGRKSFLTVSRPIFYPRFPSAFTHRTRLLSTISIRLHTSIPPFFLIFHTFSNLHLQHVAYVTDATYLHNNALDLRVHVFTTLCILWPAFYTDLCIQL